MKDFLNQEFAAGHVWRLGLRPNVRFDFSPDVQQRDVPGELKQSYELAGQYGPQFNQLARQETEKFLTGDAASGTRGLLDIYGKDAAPAFAKANRDASTAQREQDLADVRRLGAGAVESFRSANPQQKALVDALNAEALGGVQAGRNLPPALQRKVEQNVRSAQASRGFGFGMDNALQEALATTNEAENYFQNNFNRATSVAGLNAATSGDPFQLVTGRASGAGGVDLLNLGNQNAQAGNGQVLGMTGNLLDYNANADASRRIMGAQNDASIVGAGISAL